MIHNVSERFALTIELLLRIIGAQQGGGIHPQRMPTAVIALICHRIRRIAAQYNAVIARIAAGTLRRLPVRQPRPKSEPPAASQPRSPAQSWPYRLQGRFGWLVRNCRIAAPCAGQLIDHMNDPEMQAALAAAPQLRRILRPLCRMLGVTIPPIPLAPEAPASEFEESAPGEAAPPRAPKIRVNPPPALGWARAALPWHLSMYVNYYDSIA